MSEHKGIDNGFGKYLDGAYASRKGIAGTRGQGSDTTEDQDGQRPTPEDMSKPPSTGKPDGRTDTGFGKYLRR
ncbi:hypothetical protein FK529_09320 [Tsukamurella asaccharolytica]|uniref:Uncharacterized protein n=1 Tax=Tsukamurella asaccharolytica TaxID=2592067 RepID=A0A5C5RB92_9ACTN|nr:hypothetical protein [Tsukamurella asaccharolytica]TWS19391.1 hypothetical protein FK529_09320 [Tsukamurella asaccharolytica]